MTGPCPSGCGRAIDYRAGCRPCTRKACLAILLPLAAAVALLPVLP